MSTRSYIGRWNEDGKIDFIYAHWDGYPSNNGRILQDHYKDTEKIKELISLGSLSSLGERIHPTNPKRHTFDYEEDENGRYHAIREEDVCLFYGRDRGDDDVAPITKNTVEEVFEEGDGWIEFIYLWDGSSWTAYSPCNCYGDTYKKLLDAGTKGMPLEDVLAIPIE